MSHGIAKIILDSVSPNGDRLTTFEITFIRWVLAEKNTHRALSKNSASSRAIPVEKQLKNFIENPAMPLVWTSEQPGMQGGTELTGKSLRQAQRHFRKVHNYTAKQTRKYLKRHPDKATRLHKSLLNRLLEPFLWHTVIVTGTNAGLENFFKLRCSPLAQPELRVVADAMQVLYRESVPTPLKYREWHMPYLRPEDDWSTFENVLEAKKKVSTARCARVSYLTHAGIRDTDEDVAMYERLMSADPRHDCYDDQTEILTEDGFKLFKDIQESKVAAWDSVNKTLKYEHPEEIMSFDYSGKMFKVNHPKVNLLITPNHRMWVSTRINHGSEGMEWQAPGFVSAEDLGNSSMVRYFKSAPLVNSPDIELAELPSSDNHDALLRLVGFFLGDGHSGRPQDYNPNRISFHLRQTRKIEYLYELSRQLGWTLLKQQNDSYAFALEGVGRTFRNAFYDERGAKRLIETFNQRQSLLVLDGLKNSDGSIKRKTWTYSSTSKLLIDSVERLIIHAGLSCTVDSGNKAGLFNISVHTLSSPVINQGRINTETEEYDGKVWCARVSTGLLVVRREGQTVICGNSPPEHVATPAKKNEKPLGNLTGWHQLRHYGQV